LKLTGDRPYPIRTFYLDGIQKKIHWDSEIIDYATPGITEQMYNLARKIAIICIKQSEGEPSERKSSILVFLPGIYEIECFEKFLNDETTRNTW
jgi:HrpA-like RNA helicase